MAGYCTTRSSVLAHYQKQKRLLCGSLSCRGERICAARPTLAPWAPHASRAAPRPKEPSYINPSLAIAPRAWQRSAIAGEFQPPAPCRVLVALCFARSVNACRKSCGERPSMPILSMPRKLHPLIYRVRGHPLRGQVATTGFAFVLLVALSLV